MEEVFGFIIETCIEFFAYTLDRNQNKDSLWYKVAKFIYIGFILLLFVALLLLILYLFYTGEMLVKITSAIVGVGVCCLFISKITKVLHRDDK